MNDSVATPPVPAIDWSLLEQARGRANGRKATSVPRVVRHTSQATATPAPMISVPGTDQTVEGVNLDLLAHAQRVARGDLSRVSRHSLPNGNQEATVVRNTRGIIFLVFAVIFTLIGCGIATASIKVGLAFFGLAALLGVYGVRVLTNKAKSRWTIV